MLPYSYQYKKGSPEGEPKFVWFSYVILSE